MGGVDCVVALWGEPSGGPARIPRERGPGDAWAYRLATSFHDHDVRTFDRMQGDFAFAFWNGQGGSLSLVADTSGHWPIYYAMARDEGILAFANDTKVLRHLAFVGSGPDDDTVVDILCDRPWQLGHTVFANIDLLAPGYRLDWQTLDPVARVRRYWTPGAYSVSATSREDVLENFESLVVAATRERLDVAAGTSILLGGGLDSSAIAAIASEWWRERAHSVAGLTAISAMFSGLPCDEADRIGRVVVTAGLPWTGIDAQALELTLGDLENQVSRSDHPLLNVQGRLLSAEAGLARSMGAEVAVTGIGGDELGHDSTYAADLIGAAGWSRLSTVARTLAGLHGSAPGREARALVRSATRAHLLRTSGWARATVARRAVRDQSWLQPEMHNRGQAGRERRWLYDGTYASAYQQSIWADLHHSRLQYGHFATASALRAHGLRYRAPLLDRRLFELVLGCDPRWLPRYSDEGRIKPLIADGLRRYLPESFRHQPRWKVEFGAYNLLQLRNLLPALRSVLLDGEWHSGRYVAPSVARAVLDATVSPPPGGGTDTDYRQFQRLCGIVGVELWLRHLQNSND